MEKHIFIKSLNIFIYIFKTEIESTKNDPTFKDFILAQ